MEAAGRRALSVQTDVADAASCQALVDAAMAEFGRVDILVNNAGVGTAVPATRETPEQFSQVIDINLNGDYWMAQACGRVMQPGSSIINISSVLGITTAGLPQAAYAASKAGVIGLTRDLAQQWTGRKGIRVNAIAPGFFASEMTDTYPPGYLESQQARIPAGRKGDPREPGRDAGVPGLRRRRVRHRADPRGRRRHDHHLSRCTASVTSPRSSCGSG
ncbi:SDR family oxidoreductase [Nocardioides convexus]|uniref:SDR family NAD(P)-dependent oxidoreductase n=1 Tax=Nocardioides convexus TaxID=2712224 RepID=UPI0024189AC7|nr:SDR family oxidoreductase [Nocardioides convexus]